MTNIPKEAIDAATAALLEDCGGTSDPILLDLAEGFCRDQAERAILAALPYLEGYAAGQEAMRERIAATFDDKARIQRSSAQWDEAGRASNGPAIAVMAAEKQAAAIRALPVIPARSKD